MSTVQNNSRSTQQENHNHKIVTGSRLLDLLSSETPSWKEHRDQLTSSETPSEIGERDQVKNSKTSSWRGERDQAKNSETSSWRGEGDQVKNSETPSWRGQREVKSSETPSSERQKDEVKCSETPTWRGQRGRSKSSETPISRGEKDKMKSSEAANWRGQRDRVKSSETPNWTGQSHKVKNLETASSRGQRDQAKSAETPSLRAKTGKVKSLETASSRGQRDQVTSSETPSWIVQRDEAKSSGPRTKLENLMNKSSNKFCADCDSPNPKWVSLNIGVFICIKCSGIHRSLGVHISKVISVNLDDWTDEQVDALADLGGNAEANEKYEAFLPDYIRKPKPDSSIEDRADFIRSKYEKLEFSTYDEDKHVCQFLPSHERSSSSSPQVCLLPEDRRQNEKHPTRQKIGNAFRNSWGRKESESKQAKKNSALLQASMVEFVGLVKVNVVKGINLVIRDVRSSDPYVILALGHQSVKTRVIKSNLNPVWNESLLLSIPDNIPPLKVVVYDKDRFSNDDFMGEAEIDIQPLLTAARAYERSTLNESTQLGTWKATKENTLVEDGIINLVDGKVKQEINLRLQKVERGVLQIELECLPLTQ